LVEQLAFNQLVAGSNPARPTIFKRARLRRALFRSSFLSIFFLDDLCAVGELAL
jgi:hypothetical protein